MTLLYCIVLLLLQATTIKCFADYSLIERIRANVTTNQSSTYSPSSNPQDFDSSKAIDGVQNYLVDTCKCCSVTHGALPSWWQIDLGQKYLLSSLQIFGRAADYNYQLENATIYAGNVSIKTNMTLVYKVPSMTSTRNFTKKLDAIIAQNFRVELNQRELTLCEFKLFGKECEIGYFGSGCLHSCHCSDNNKCDQVTGKCQTSGCLAGWTGEACEDDCPEGTFGLNCYGICNCKDDAECRKTDGFCSNGCAFGWSGFNCSKDLNLIKRIRANVVTSQSSTFAPYQNPSDFNSSKAIDGVHNYSIDSCKCCSVTDGHIPSWWQIDLTQRYLIGAIQIFGRESGYPEQLQHAVVYAGNASMASNMTSNKMKVYEVPNITDTRIFTNDLDPLIVQYFLVELPQKVLTLCEFKLYEKECKAGYFGSGCLHGCHCSDNKKCDQVTGECQTPGCLVGWKGGACTDPCSHHTFGGNCSSDCHCSNNSTCDAVSGKCFVGICDPGWRTESCYKSCGHRRFGQNCTSVCHCLNNASCNAISGECHNGICAPGWQTPSCDKECNHRSFGYNCSSTCHCINNTKCNSTTGTCKTELCDPGWQGPRCDRVCDYHAFGYNCSSTCHCLNNTDCNSSTGQCYIELCDFGWQGPRCDEEQNILRHLDAQTDMSSTFLNWTSNLAIDGNIGPKPDGCNCCSGTKNSAISWWTVDLGKQYPINSVTVFSREFDQLYQQLADFELYIAQDTGKNSFRLVENSTRRIDGNKHVLTFSNKLTRFIKIQRPGVLTLCEVMVSEGECQVGTFGEECSEICHCGDDLACDKISGYCQSDACKSGWIGKSCNQECPKNRFGDRCSETCFCAEGTCTSNYGVCQNGCQQGYTGSHCNQVDDFNNHTRPANEEKNTATLIAVVVGGSIAGLIICVLVGVVVVKLRRKRSEGNKSHYSTPNTRANQPDQDYDTLDILNDNQGRRNTAYENEVVSNM